MQTNSPPRTSPLAAVFGSFADVGAAYGVSESTLYRLLSDGRFRAVKSGGRALLDLSSVAAYFQSCPEIKPVRTRRAA